jgi:hypothetical protein
MINKSNVNIIIYKFFFVIHLDIDYHLFEKENYKLKYCILII